ncbi:MAG: flippase-like domain-containing protein [Candidatus Omnitrophica bacterium]|nr:flippase-like domain-containing protein [Candidatus Omnitrophota bacterium]
MNNKNLSLFFRILVTIGIFIALFKFIPYQQVFSTFKNSNKTYLLLAVLVFFPCYLIGVARWRYLLAAQGIKSAWSDVFYAFFCGLFFNLFFPSFVAGDLFRAVSISRRYGQKKEAASSVLMDRFSGAVALNLLALISYIFGRKYINDRSVFLTLSILTLAMIFSSLVIFSKRFFGLLARVLSAKPKLHLKIISLHDQLYFFKRKPSVFFKSLFFSFPIQILTAAAFFITSRSFGLDVSIVYFLMVVPLIMSIALVPITIAGAGTREASAVFFFSLIGIDKNIGLGISLFNLIYMVAASIFGGILYVGIYHRRLQSYTQDKNP